MTRIEDTICEYIRCCFLDDGQTTPGHVRLDEDLLAVLDSLQILRMLMDLESQFAIKIDNSELTPENLGTVERLAAFIGNKQQQATCQGLPS